MQKRVFFFFFLCVVKLLIPIKKSTAVQICLNSWDIMKVLEGREIKEGKMRVAEQDGGKGDRGREGRKEEEKEREAEIEKERLWMRNEEQSLLGKYSTGGESLSVCRLTFVCFHLVAQHHSCLRSSIGHLSRNWALVSRKKDCLAEKRHTHFFQNPHCGTLCLCLGLFLFVCVVFIKSYGRRLVCGKGREVHFF